MTIKHVLDHLGRSVAVPFPPKRIVSLCPSLTETLFALGVGERVIGRTQFCIHPTEALADVVRVGGTKQVKDDVLASLAPDLIIAEKEENPKEMVERLAESYPVYVTDVETYEDALHMIRDLGRVVGARVEAKQLIREIETGFAELMQVDGKRVAYFIWQNPYMVVGDHTYIHSLLSRCGFVNVFAEAEGRYPAVTEDDIRAAAPDYLFLSSEPFPFAQKHREALSALFPDSTVVLVDGEMFSWYGSRMVAAARYLRNLVRDTTGSSFNT
ncbi:ABC-type Fe3+-hydroxamate transport system substrate-binding protein [Aneurinibacillus soli]|uniref:Vitamin B12-binding protein n=1 Tax=Aneurinibacillus soli TaxID=1500254 RepID=A0A0U4WJ83_9BACL|nr:helical backbone metal receptor [Aneurinibacillus soli]PYE62179.1 ABC-type Fe3+-hydroxamate transport system substrate-binding protein [Aneurinibacillus soli]BAU28633.1 Vitamin B12-binding protein precursor [Aneurinibacillus soli]